MRTVGVRARPRVHPRLCPRTTVVGQVVGQAEELLVSRSNQVVRNNLVARRQDMDDLNAMLTMVGWANRRLGVLSGGDFGVVVVPTAEGYAAVLLGHVDEKGLEVARWEAPHW